MKKSALIFAVACVLLGVAFGAAIKDGEEKKKEECLRATPCGWAVYDRFSPERRIDYFMRNTCECPKEKKCLRTDDDISISAYVYRCRDDVKSN